MPADTLYPRSAAIPQAHPHGVSRRTMWAVLALGLAFVLIRILMFLPASPGRVIRGELKSAAADLREARAKPDSAALRRLRGDFRIML